MGLHHSSLRSSTPLGRSSSQDNRRHLCSEIHRGDPELLSHERPSTPRRSPSCSLEGGGHGFWKKRIVKEESRLLTPRVIVSQAHFAERRWRFKKTSITILMGSNTPPENVVCRR